jgi:ParB-like chromosome segregation protein Spo0J
MGRMIDVRILPIDRLVPAEYNPRKPLTAAAERRLRQSLEVFGLVEPLVWNERTGRVVGGHARLRLLRELGHADVPVSVVRLDDDRERALNVMLNNLEAQGRYDRAKLHELLEPLAGTEHFALTGFDPSVLATLDYRPAAMEPLPERDEIEIAFAVPKAAWPDVRPALDDLAKRFDLAVHVRE